MQRAIVCPCGHPMAASNDIELYKVVRRHVDEKHPELNYRRADIEKLLNEKAYNAS